MNKSTKGISGAGVYGLLDAGTGLTGGKRDGSHNGIGLREKDLYYENANGRITVPGVQNDKRAHANSSSVSGFVGLGIHGAPNGVNTTAYSIPG